MKVCWSIESQNAQIQNQGLKWKRQPTLELVFEFGRDAIELILNQNLNWGLDSINKKLWTNLEIETFWRLFLLNETTCFVQNDDVSFTVP
jgi:hypothetical protein